MNLEKLKQKLYKNVFTIKDYKTFVEHGTYSLNGKEYLYENYTLIKGNEGVKIIMSYLKNDKMATSKKTATTKPVAKKVDPVVHFEMPTDDRKRMSKFYSSAFGWKMLWVIILYLCLLS